MSGQTRAILWAQWRTVWNHLPHANWLSIAFTTCVGVLWYGGFAFLAFSASVLIANPERLDLIARVLPRALLAVFLYWQVMPLLMASTGSSLDMRKLMIYPVPQRELFALEILLRISTGSEALLILTGAAVGSLCNPKLPPWAPLGFIPFVLFNLFLCAGVRDMLTRLMARKRFREIAAFLFVIVVALPQVLFLRGGGRVKQIFGREQPFFWPWTAAANFLLGRQALLAIGILTAWTVVAYVFGRTQFERSLRFDGTEQSASATVRPGASAWLERFYRLPGVFFADPLGALIEKELRVLSRSARFRLVFLMGFSFGLLIWIPVTFGRGGSPDSFFSRNYLTIVSMYALLLLSDVLFWNSLGFDRSAVQLYFLLPLKLSRMLMAKNIAALVWVLLEITIIAAVCAVVRLPVQLAKLAEAYAVALTVALFLMAIGNLTSAYNPRAINPARSFRSGSGSRTQALLVLVYPVAIGPIALAYLARYAFDTDLAFWGVLACAAVLGVVVYSIAMDSAVSATERRKEAIIGALSGGSGPVESG